MLCRLPLLRRRKVPTNCMFLPAPYDTAEILYKVRPLHFCAPERKRQQFIGPVFTVNVHTPTEGVIGIRFDHLKSSEPAPTIPLFPDQKPVPSNAALSRADDTCSLSTGGLTVDITENPYTLTFRSSKHTLTSAGYRYQGLYDVPSKWTYESASRTSCLYTDPASNPNPEPVPEVIRYIHTELNISPGELIYGFGEQFGSFVKNGEQFKQASHTLLSPIRPNN
jgi:hypothetical protein